jgi:hypothetical protein
MQPSTLVSRRHVVQSTDRDRTPKPVRVFTGECGSPLLRYVWVRQIMAFLVVSRYRAGMGIEMRSNLTIGPIAPESLADRDMLVTRHEADVFALPVTLRICER